jgi:hypothetical protein
MSRMAVMDANLSVQYVGVSQERAVDMVYYQIPPAVQEQLNRIEAMLTALTAEEAKK